MRPRLSLDGFLKAGINIGGCFLTFVVIGIILSVVIAVWYRNSPNYCRDCNTGLGICMIGFVLSIPLTLVTIYLSQRFSDDETP